jgi:hypothetical protein
VRSEANNLDGDNDGRRTINLAAATACLHRALTGTCSSSSRWRNKKKAFQIVAFLSLFFLAPFLSHRILCATACCSSILAAPFVAAAAAARNGKRMDGRERTAENAPNAAKRFRKMAFFEVTTNGACFRRTCGSYWK